MKNIIRASIFGLITVLSTHGLAQIWVGSDDFNSPVLDPSKWSGGGPNFVKTPTAVSFFSNVSTGEVSDYVLWKQNLPKDLNWSVTIQASISPAFSTSGPNSWAEALLVVASQDFSSYFTNCLHRDDTFDIVPNWGLNKGNNQEIIVPVGLDTILLRMDYDKDSQSLTSSHASLLQPNLFTQTKTLSTSNWQNLNQFVVAVGGYSKDTTITSGLLQLDDFSIVPEPSALSLLAVGLGGLAMMRRRRS